MYDMPHLHAAHDRLWAGIAARVPGAPATLSRTADPWAHWHAPDLVLSQTCGLPYRARLHGTVTLVCTPDYGLTACPPGYYHSVLVRRRGEGRALVELAQQGTLAYNDPLSQSGWAAVVAHLAAAGTRPAACVETGGHALSLAAVRDGRADYAAIDAVTFALWCAAHPEAARAIDPFEHTAPTPGLPFISRQGQDPDRLAAAIAAAIDALPASDRAALHLRGIVRIPAEAYLAHPIPPAP